MKLCFATNNQHKISEVSKAIEGHLKILSLKDLHIFEELPETRDTLEGNSLQKADFVFRKANIVSFADDSGLEVDALLGAPGVHSAHYAGSRDDDKNIDLLLQNLKNVHNRNAQFRTVIALVGFEKPQFFEGIVRGQILTTKKGKQGFGYDPVFLPDGHNKTFAEMSVEEKNQISHRSIAVGKLVAYLNKNAIG